MSILVDKDTRLVVQGITGREGAFHATRNKAYGTNVVAGVTPGKAGGAERNLPPDSLGQSAWPASCARLSAIPSASPRHSAASSRLSTISLAA